MTKTTYKVKGMTCGHCVAAVKSEVESLKGVDSVEVDLESGAVTVVSASGLSVNDVRAAVDEAGYELVS